MTWSTVGEGESMMWEQHVGLACDFVQTDLVRSLRLERRHIQCWYRHCRALDDDMLAVSELGDDDVQRAECLVDHAKCDEKPGGNGFKLKSAKRTIS